MKKLIKILVLLAVFALAVFAATSCGMDCACKGGNCGCNECQDGDCAAQAATSGLYIKNDPSNPGGHMYSMNGVDYYQIFSDPADFVTAYYLTMDEEDTLHLWFGAEGDPIVTPATISITRQTVAEIYLDNIFASTLTPGDPDNEELIAGASAIVLEGSAGVTLEKGQITTDGARAVTVNSTGALTVDGTLSGGEYGTLIHSASDVATIYINGSGAEDAAYLQLGGYVINSSASSSAAVILNESDRDVSFFAGIAAATTQTDPLLLSGFGYGAACVVDNRGEGAVRVTELASAEPVYLMSANDAKGVVSLSGGTGGTLLDMAGGSIINYNDNELTPSFTYAVKASSSGTIRIEEGIVYSRTGYGIYKSTGGTVSVTDSYIHSANRPAIFAMNVNVTVDNSAVFAQNADSIYVYGGIFSISTDDAAILQPDATYSYLRLEGNIACDIFGIHFTGDSRVAVLFAPDDVQGGFFFVEDFPGAVQFFRYWAALGTPAFSQNPIAMGYLEMLALPYTLILEEKYTLTPDAGITHGTITGTSPQSAFEGNTMAVSFAPESGYYLKQLLYFEAGLPVVLYENNTRVYDLTMVNITVPGEDITVSAVFEPIPVEAYMDDVTDDYPNTVTLAPVVTTYAGITYFYTWYYEGQLLPGENGATLTLTEVDESGSYTVIVTNSIGAEQRAANAVATVRPYEVETVWHSESEYVYNGELQGPAASAKRPDDSDLPVNVLGRSGQAGTFTLTAMSADTNYALINNTIEYTIEPLGVFAGWGAVTSFEYDGSAHAPDAQALDINGNPLIVLVYGSQINASSTPYIAHAEPTNANYYFTNADKEFTIYPKAVTVEWSFEYTDTNLSIYFYTGFDQIAKISATYRNIFSYSVPLGISVVGEETESTEFSVPDTYLVTADFLVPAPNYSLTLASTRVIMYRAKPVITVPQTNLTFLYDGASHALPFSYAYVDDSLILFKVDDRETANSFVYPGVYSVSVSTKADAYHDAAPPVMATVRILRTMLERKDEEGELVASAYNASGVDPLTQLVVRSTPGSSPALDTRFTDAWGKSVIRVYSLSLSGVNTDIEGDTVIRLKVEEDILNNRSLKLRCLRDGKTREVAYTVEDGYLVFTADELGEYVLVGDSLMNSVLGLGIIVAVVALIIGIGIATSVKKRRGV